MARSSSLVKASLPRQRKLIRPRRSPKSERAATAAVLCPGALLDDAPLAGVKGNVVDFFGAEHNGAFVSFGTAGAEPPERLASVLQGDGLAAPAPRRASDETLAVHAGEKLGSGMADMDSIATPIVSGTTHWFRSSADLIAFKEGRRHSFEYGRYGNPTVKVLEDKIRLICITSQN